MILKKIFGYVALMGNIKALRLAVIVTCFCMMVHTVAHSSTIMHSQTSSGDNSTNTIIIQAFAGVTVVPRSSNSSNNGQNGEERGSNVFRIEYMRAFGATKVPLFMKYVVAKSTTDHRAIAAPEFKKYWDDRWKKPLFPVTSNNIWNDLVDDIFYGINLYACAVEPKRADVINFFLNPRVGNEENDLRNTDYQINKKKLLEEGFRIKIAKNWKNDFLGLDESDIGFLFVIFENDSKNNFYDITLSYYEIQNNNVKQFPRSGSSPNAETFNLDWESPSRNGLREAVLDAQKKEISAHKFASIRQGEAMIWLLGVYKANADGMPDYYLTNVQVPTKIEFLAGGKKVEQKVRGPHGLKAGRLELPRDWFSMRAWTGQ